MNLDKPRCVVLIFASIERARKLEYLYFRAILYRIYTSRKTYMQIYLKRFQGCKKQKTNPIEMVADNNQNYPISHAKQPRLELCNSAFCFISSCKKVLTPKNLVFDI